MNAIDTNIWLYAVDHRELSRRQQAFDLLNDLASCRDCITPWQVASEYVNGIRRCEREKLIVASEVDDWVAWMFELLPIPTPQHTTVLSALDLSRRYCLSHWDSMQLAACIEAGVTTLYSEDLSHGTKYDTVQVVNPFV